MQRAIRFRSIPLNEIPLRSSPAPLTGQGKSRWDAALAELVSHQGVAAIRVHAASRKERAKLKSGLQMTARNRGLSVKVLDDPMGKDFYAWLVPATTIVEIK